MKNKFKIGSLFGIIILFCLPGFSFSQPQEVEVEVRQSDHRIRVRLFHHHSSTLFGAFSQDYRVTVENLTQDKLLVHLEFSANLSCGTRKSTLIGLFGEGLTINPGEVVGEKWGTDGKNTAVRLGDNACPRASLIKLGKNNTGSDLYSAISSLGYRLIRIENISEKERAAAEAKKQEEEKNRKEAEAKKQKEEENRKEAEDKKREEQSSQDKANAQETTQVQGNTGQTTKVGADNFWSDSNSKNNTRTAQDDNLRSASQFGGGLGDITEGGYFMDDKGGFYKKERGNARVVSKAEYDRAKGNQVLEQIAHQEQVREEKIKLVDDAINTSMNMLATSFYAQQLSRGIKDATTLGGDFDNIEELNAVFSQKMQDIAYLSQELRTVSAGNLNTYISSRLSSATSTSEQAAVSAIGILGSVASSISSDRAERKAREELAAQRAEAEAEIKERQRIALVNIRNEISKVFPEGGMPLSSHKIEAPILYLFAYAADKTVWEKDQEIPLSISNVIPVYRYRDGTYPYTSNIKQTFENGGIKDPKIIGYFTDKKEAEKYRESLITIAPNAKFALNSIEIKVKEQNGNALQTSTSDTDYWGNKKSDSNAKNNNTETELDFWGMPVKKKETETKKVEPKKQDNFWNN